MSKRKTKRLLTSENVLNIARPNAGRKEIGDAQVRGLVLRVTASGARSWSVCYKVRGEAGTSKRGRGLRGSQHRITLGDAAVIGVEDARDKAREILRSANEGVDPRTALAAAEEHRTANTVRAFTKRIIEIQKKNRPKSWMTGDAVLRNHVLPRWGDRPMADIRKGDVAALLDDLIQQKSKATAREVGGWVRWLFSRAMERDVVQANPAAGIKLPPKESRGRALSDAELRALWLAAPSLGYPYGPVVQLLVLTGCRKGEIEGATWDDIDSDARTLTIPKERHKQGKGHVVPLTDEAWRVISALPRKTGHEHLFLIRPKNRAGLKEVWKPADLSRSTAEKLLGLVETQMRADHPDMKATQHFRIHDLRHTVKTRLSALGVRKDVRDAVLGHAQTGMDRVYDHHAFLKEGRAALELLAKHVRQLAKQREKVAA